MMTRQQIVEALKDLGLKTGDIVMLHSSLSAIGQVEGGAEALYDAFLEVLGPSGTLVVPTFGGPALGVMTELVKNDPRSVQSIHPFASVAAIGADAEEICRDHWKAETAHGKDTPYTRIAEKGGYVCLLGVDQDRNTTLHSVEALMRMPYLKPTEERTFETPAGQVTKSWPFFPGPHRDFIGLDRVFRDSGKMKVGRVGKAVTRLIKSKDLIDIGMELARKDPSFALTANPSRADGVSQRADLRRDRLAREAFTAAAAASLAGRYVPEMIENCQAAGIDRLELDAIQGKPIHMLSTERVAAAAEELRAAGLEVIALRTEILSQKLSDLLTAAGAAKVRRVVLPLSDEAPHWAREAQGHKLDVSFVNVNQDHQKVFEILSAVYDKQLPAKLVFNGPAFVRAGEMPFLDTYRKKMSRFIDQLDVADGTWDGQVRPLDQGNAEIREMVSALRCRSFAGYMVLAAPNHHVGTLMDAAAAFDRVLDTI